MCSRGYDYSVWFVPKNYMHLQEQYGITHIPHVTLETNLLLKEAFHVHKNAVKSILIEYNPKYVEFPVCYEHDPLIGYGWYVNVLELKGRKESWKPHMSVQYVPRTKKNMMKNIIEKIPPQGTFECCCVIADTRSINPLDWSIDKKYINLKASSGFLVEGNEECGTLRKTRSCDEYFGFCQGVAKIDACKEVKERLHEIGILMSDYDIALIIDSMT